MASTSYIELDQYALSENVDFIRSLVNSDVRISAVVKGNAYGHGVSQFIPLLINNGIDHFSVFSSPEAKDVAAYASPSSSIMIMGYIDRRDRIWVLKNGIEFYVADYKFLQEMTSLAMEMNLKAKIHLEVETGMYRTGFSLKNFKKALDWIKEYPDNIDIQGIASHFAGAESIANYQRIRKQLQIFKRRVKLLEQNGLKACCQHIASSAATINYPDSHLDMVRTGILLYGYWPTHETRMKYMQRSKQNGDQLKRVLNWHSEVMQIKKVPAGAFVGYGLSFQAYEYMTIMIVPVGYCNGFSRSLSNNGHVIVRGGRAPIIGMINMNMVICDISNISGVQRGDKVTLVGSQGDAEITFSSFAEMNISMNYEILARLPENIERITL